MTDQPASVKLAHHADANGSGKLTAGMLLDLVHQLADSGVPPEAHLVIRSGEDQRDHNWSWSIRAAW